MKKKPSQQKQLHENHNQTKNRVFFHSLLTGLCIFFHSFFFVFVSMARYDSHGCYETRFRTKLVCRLREIECMKWNNSNEKVEKNTHTHRKWMKEAQQSSNVSSTRNNYVDGISFSPIVPLSWCIWKNDRINDLPATKAAVKIHSYTFNYRSISKNMHIHWNFSLILLFFLRSSHIFRYLSLHFLLLCLLDALMMMTTMTKHQAHQDIFHM